MKEVMIFTDGACSGNPGPGGFGTILRFGEHEKEISGGEAETTNNRMELMAVIKGLEALKEPCKVTVVTDCWRHFISHPTWNIVRSPM